MLRKQLTSWVLVWGVLCLIWCGLVVAGDVVLDAALAHSDKMGRQLPVLACLIRQMLDSSALSCMGGIAIISACAFLLHRFGAPRNIGSPKTLLWCGVAILVIITLAGVAAVALPFLPHDCPAVK